MAKELIREFDPYHKLYRDTKTGIAWVENTSDGIAHTCHPNISASGSARGMKTRKFWGEKDRTVRCRGFIYNIDLFVLDGDVWDQEAALACRCGGKCQEYQTKNKDPFLIQCRIHKVLEDFTLLETHKELIRQLALSLTGPRPTQKSAPMYTCKTCGGTLQATRFVRAYYKVDPETGKLEFQEHLFDPEDPDPVKEVEENVLFYCENDCEDTGVDITNLFRVSGLEPPKRFLVRGHK